MLDCCSGASWCSFFDFLRVWKHKKSMQMLPVLKRGHQYHQLHHQCRRHRCRGCQENRAFQECRANHRYRRFANDGRSPGKGVFFGAWHGFHTVKWGKFDASPEIDSIAEVLLKWMPFKNRLSYKFRQERMAHTAKAGINPFKPCNVLHELGSWAMHHLSRWPVTPASSISFGLYLQLWPQVVGHWSIILARLSLSVSAYIPAPLCMTCFHVENWDGCISNLQKEPPLSCTHHTHPPSQPQSTTAMITTKLERVASGHCFMVTCHEMHRRWVVEISKKEKKKNDAAPSLWSWLDWKPCQQKPSQSPGNKWGQILGNLEYRCTGCEALHLS